MTYAFSTDGWWDDGYANENSQDGRDACSDAAFIQAIGSGTTWSLKSFVLTFAARLGGNLPKYISPASFGPKVPYFTEFFELNEKIS